MNLDLRTRGDMIYEYLLDMIGKMKPGENKLPTEEELSASLGVSRATVREALKTLLRNGYIKTVHGKGTFGLPSVVNMKHRTNLNGNFLELLREGDYPNAQLDINWVGFMPFDKDIKSLMPSVEDSGYMMEWEYHCGDEVLIVGKSQIIESAFARTPSREDGISDLAQFAFRFLTNQFAYISYEIHSNIDAQLAQKFGVDAGVPFLAWNERFFDLADKQVGAGVYYFNPEKILFQTTINIEKINKAY